jgi:hypothetical protein
MHILVLALRASLFLVALFFGAAGPHGSEDPPAPAASLSTDEKAKVIDRLIEKLKEAYVFPELAETMSKAITDRRAAGAYDSLRGAEEFAKQLTEDLQGISHDKHLRVRPEGQRAAADPKKPPFPRTEEDYRRRNFGFEKVELLPGNIGYLDLRMFAPADLAGDTAAAAMNFLANADALVIDLRKNGGGQPEMVQTFCSYLFSPEPVHLNDLYFRPTDETRQFWTLPWLPGRRFPEKDVYVLTSSYTFSGAEECAYNLKTQKRATLVGETTGGGAHPGGNVPIGAGLAVFLPTGRAINPVTKTDWEGTGVEPDVKVTAELALATAHELALKKLAGDCQDEARRATLASALEDVGRELAAAKPAAAPRAK